MAKVLIHGLDGLGAEIAKNLVLTTGVRYTLTLSDITPVQMWNLCGTSIYSMDSVGQKKADVCAKKLKEIGSSVEISSLSTELTSETLSRYQVVVLANVPQKMAIEFDSYCHNHKPKISFIYVECRGLFGRLFCDFGADYRGDDNQEWNFKVLGEALGEFDDLQALDETKRDETPLLHLAFQTLHRFLMLFDRFPRAGSEEDADRFIGLVKEMNNEIGSRLETIDAKLLAKFAYGAEAILSPMCLIFGGLVGQQVLKALSWKPKTIFQFMYFDAVECVPSEAKPEDLHAIGSRYDAQIAIFGQNFQTRIKDAHIFFVGSGAASYEFIKAMATMGICCSGGKLYVVDDVTSWDIAMAASIVNAKFINPAIDIQVLDNNASTQVGNDEFWKSLSVVINSLNMSVHERPQIDWKTFYYRKPMIKLSTFLDNCNTKIIIPCVTDEYGISEASNSPHFLREIKDCFRWAFSEFQILFEKTPAEAKAYYSAPNKYIDEMMKANVVEARHMLKWILEYIDIERSMLGWARGRFEHYFNKEIEMSPFKFCGKVVPLPLQFSSGDKSHLQFVMAAEKLISRTIGFPSTFGDNRSPELYLDDMVTQWQAKTAGKVAVPVEDETTSLEAIAAALETSRTKLPADCKIKPIFFDEDDAVHMEMITSLANLRARVFRIPETDKFSAKMIAKAVAAEKEIPSFAAIPAGLLCLELYKVLAGNDTTEDYREADVQLACGKFKMDQPNPPCLIKNLIMKWSLWDNWVLEGNDPTVNQVVELLYQDLKLEVKTISFYGRQIWTSSWTSSSLSKRLMDLVRERTMLRPSEDWGSFLVSVTCKTNAGVDISIPPLIFIKTQENGLRWQLNDET